MSTKSNRRLLRAALLAGLPLAAAEVDVSKLPPVANRTVDFAQEIRPIFASSCVTCHGPEKQKGGLRLDLKEAALRGGDNYAPAIHPGKSGESPLIHFVAGLVDDMVMPQKSERLSAEQMRLLRGWIDKGATGREEGKPKEFNWSLKPVTRPAVPEIRNPKSEIRNPIDAFVLAKLTEQKLTPSPEADRRTLIRRLSFDLIGLPPTPEETRAFLADKRPDAYEQLVERL